MALQPITIYITQTLAQRLEESRLLGQPQLLEEILEQVLQRHAAITAAENTVAALDADPERFSPAEIQAEIDAHRAEKKAAREGRA